MSIWALADLHLSLGVPDKTMEVFGPHWDQYIDKMATHWQQCVHVDDLVLIAGDISWAMRLEEAEKDLQWIDQLPGTKVLIRGNHDYWWDSVSKVKRALPPSLHIIQNDSFDWKDISIGGSRLWDTQEYSFNQTFAAVDPQAEKIYDRELARLEMSLKSMRQDRRLVMTHYPPLGSDLRPSRASRMLTQYGVTDCVFGHLHGLDNSQNYFGQKDGVKYHLTASDYLNFCPKKIL
ncbi:MAG: metallophosphoesterase [Verrucomicrobia bacterium]|nr:metallophosphoesterase [Verrucomicrobiota bacterium]MBS0647102.1 metallophosphoesterase [Verrucomicrobiota bacterium]